MPLSHKSRYIPPHRRGYDNDIAVAQRQEMRSSPQPSSRPRGRVWKPLEVFGVRADHNRPHSRFQCEARKSKVWERGAPRSTSNRASAEPKSPNVPRAELDDTEKRRMMDKFKTFHHEQVADKMRTRALRNERESFKKELLPVILPMLSKLRCFSECEMITDCVLSSKISCLRQFTILRTLCVSKRVVFVKVASASWKLRSISQRTFLHLLIPFVFVRSVYANHDMMGVVPDDIVALITSYHGHSDDTIPFTQDPVEVDRWAMSLQWQSEHVLVGIALGNDWLISSEENRIRDDQFVPVLSIDIRLCHAHNSYHCKTERYQRYAPRKRAAMMARNCRFGGCGLDLIDPKLIVSQDAV